MYRYLFRESKFHSLEFMDFLIFLMFSSLIIKWSQANVNEELFYYEIFIYFL